MARSQDDPLFGDVQHRTWTYRTEPVDNCTSGRLGDISQQPPFSNAGAINDNLYVNANAFSASDVYLNKHPYTMNMPSGDITDEQVSINNAQSVPRANNVQNYGNAMLDLGNGQIMRVFFDENNKQIMIPVTGQYELFNHNQGLREMPLQSTIPPHMFTINQEFASKGNDVRLPQSVTASQNNNYPKENTQSNGATSSFLKDVLGNWEPNSSGTYSPFGQSFPLNHPEAPPLNLPPTQNNPHQHVELPVQNPVIKSDLSPKRNENSPLADTNNKKRIVAEVKPMRPSYSDVLAKNTKNNLPDVSRKPKTTNNSENKNSNKTASVKPERQNSINGKQNSEENKPKKENKKLTNTGSSGSESGDVNNYENEKRGRGNKKSKNKQNNAPRKWSSMDDLTKDEIPNYNTNRNSQFVIIETQAEKPQKKEKKNREKSKPLQENNDDDEDEDKLGDEESSQFDAQDGHPDVSKLKKKKESKSYTYKLSKPTPDKKKPNQTKWKRTKPGYLGLVQNYLDHWYAVSWKAMIWFLYLLSDICHMSAELSFDLCTSVFTQTYVSSQAVWRSTKDNIRRLANNKYLHYIDRKLGHTWFGFWRKIKWFKKEVEPEDGGSTKLDANIPLPATGEEAMKRLLACKGKDPYSILGVHMNCSDEDIKRYYRRQAFLVHPDKNPQPGAEEAFKILQHAFELIGEPERRTAYGAAFAACAQAEAAWSELSVLLAQLHDKMEFAANTIRCTNCGRRHKRVLTDRPCYAARYCAQCKIRHSAKEGDIWAESSMMGLLVMYYACMDGGVYQITQWASCQKKNLKQLRPDCHVVQYRIVLGNKAAANDINRTQPGHDPNLEEFLNNLYSKAGPTNTTAPKQPSPEQDAKKRRTKKSK